MRKLTLALMITLLAALAAAQEADTPPEPERFVDFEVGLRQAFQFAEALDSPVHRTDLYVVARTPFDLGGDFRAEVEVEAILEGFEDVDLIAEFQILWDTPYLTPFLSVHVRLLEHGSFIHDLGAAIGFRGRIPL